MTLPNSLLAAWPPPLSGALAPQLGSFYLIERLEASGRAAISRFQTERLNAYLRHLRAHLSDVEGLIRNSGVHGEALRLVDLPISDRATLRERIERFGALPMPRSHGRAIAHSTSGSSGVPVRFFYSQRSGRFNSTLYLHDHLRHGRDPSRPINVLRGKTTEHQGEHAETVSPDALLETGLVRIRKSVGFSVESHTDWLRRFPAPYLAIHVGALVGILDVFAREGRAAGGIEQVLTVGETVDDALRARTRELLGARIVDRYSCEETGPIAFQCPVHDGWYHVCVANVAVETVDGSGAPSPDGVPGRVLVTAFNNWASPLLRYEVGDIATLHQQCACGAQLPAISQLLGRVRGLVRLPSGERRYLRIVASHFIDAAPVREWRVTQREPLALEVELVCERALTATERDAISATLRGLTDPAFRIEIFERDSIDWGPSYKRQELVCLVED